LKQEQKMKALVCGGRYYDDWGRFCSFLDRLHAESPITAIIEGGAPGADHLAMTWAARMRIPRQRFNADWDKHGKAAGPIRNQQMLDEGKPDIVVAFPGGNGTADMVSRAKAQGFKVIEVF
jgi:hypothetical protein